MKCKHINERYIGSGGSLTDSWSIYWCPECGAIINNEDREWVLPKPKQEKEPDHQPKQQKHPETKPTLQSIKDKRKNIPKVKRGPLSQNVNEVKSGPQSVKVKRTLHPVKKPSRARLSLVRNLSSSFHSVTGTPNC